MGALLLLPSVAACGGGSGKASDSTSQSSPDSSASASSSGSATGELKEVTFTGEDFEPDDVASRLVA